MAELTFDLRDLPKTRAYTELHEQATSVLAGLRDPIAGMATMAAMLHNGFGHLWTGSTVSSSPADSCGVGPYQGTLGCLDIEFGKGVCGTAAAGRETVIVEDVEAFPGHIACDARSRSEIVVPVLAADGSLIAVLDIDSDRLAAFTEEDRVGLERLMEWFAEP